MEHNYASGDGAPAPTSATVRLACIDMAGTLVRDDGIVLDAFEQAMRAVGASEAEILAGMRHVHLTMGLPKSVVFSGLFDDDSRARRAASEFDRAVLGAIGDGHVQEITGASATLEALRERGTMICLTTGFTAEVQNALVERLGWKGSVDLVLAPAKGIRGRPYPDMVLSAILRLEVDDVRQVAVVGDTANDLLTGHRAGSGVVAGVLTGSHGRAELERAPHTHIIDSVAELPSLLSGLPAE